MQRIKRIILEVILIVFVLCSYLHAQQKTLLNAIIIIDSESSSIVNEIEKYIKSHGGKIIHSFPPHILMGYIPTNLDPELSKRYKVDIFREKVDLSRVERYGETAMFAVNIWNSNFIKKLPAPTILEPKNEEITNADKIIFRWKECPGASHYRVQISTTPLFLDPYIDTIVDKPKYTFHSLFLDEGVYHWRVSALNLLNQLQGKVIDGEWSEIASFRIYLKELRDKTKLKVQARYKKTILTIPKNFLPHIQKIKGKETLKWEKIHGAKYYRIQISSSPLFDTLIVDEIIEKPYYKTTGSNLQFGNTYYWRIMTIDGNNISDWSNISTLIVDFPEPITGDVLPAPIPYEK